MLEDKNNIESILSAVKSRDEIEKESREQMSAEFKKRRDAQKEILVKILEALPYLELKSYVIGNPQTSEDKFYKETKCSMSFTVEYSKKDHKDFLKDIIPS